MTPPRLGEYLVQRGLITNDQLVSAMLQQRRTGERLGRLLLILDYVKRLDLGRALADLWGFPFITIDADEIDVDLARAFPLDATLRFRALPLRDDGYTVTIALAEAPGTDLQDVLERVYPDRYPAFRVTTDWDLDRGITLVHQHHVAPDGEQDALAQAMGTRSHPIVSVRLPGTLPGNTVPLGGGSHREPEERHLPIYTVLVPVQHAGHAIGDLLRELRQLDYPADKLDIILLFEEHDIATLSAAKAIAPCENVRFLIVPDGDPPNYSRMCNIGLMFARGEYIVSYKADDQPPADQLKRALRAFRTGPVTLTCVQAILTSRHRKPGLLERFLPAERGAWLNFLRLRPARHPMPIPHGSLRNHFRIQLLRAHGGWEPRPVERQRPVRMRETALQS